MAGNMLYGRIITTTAYLPTSASLNTADTQMVTSAVTLQTRLVRQYDKHVDAVDPQHLHLNWVGSYCKHSNPSSF